MHNIQLLKTAPVRIPARYPALVEEVRKALAQGKLRAEEAVEEEKVRTYWEIGRLVNGHLRLHNGRAGYGMQVVPRLAADLGIAERSLYEWLQFNRAFPILRTSAELPWSHYNLLSRVEDSKERQRLLREAIRKNLSARELLAAMNRRELLASPAVDGKKPAPPARSEPAEELRPVRGNLYTYQIVKPRDLHTHPDFYSVDLGFGARMDLKLKGIARPREGQIIEAVRTEENQAGDRYRFKASSAKKEMLYTYKAAVEKVIDDDTLWAAVDLGFRVWTHHKLRFRGINAPEIQPPALRAVKPGGKGKKISRFVAETLARVSFVLVKLHGRDKFDRYLADFFYLEGEEVPEKVLRNGIYLNQVLLDRGLALPA